MESGESAQYVQLQALFGPSTLVPQSLELSHNTLKKCIFLHKISMQLSCYLKAYTCYRSSKPLKQ